MENKGNWKYMGIYERLVSGDRDFLGQIAYSIYKQRKREFIIRKQEELKTDRVPDDVIEEFVKSQTDYTLDLYRKNAVALCEEFLDVSYTPKLDKRVAEVAKAIEPQPWWYGVAQSLAGSFLFLLAGYAILKLSGSWEILLNNLFR